jgi:hypothetical protein
MSNTEMITEAQTLESATLVIHEMKQAGLVTEFLTNESARLEILEICLATVCDKWEKIAVIARTNPAFTRHMLTLVAA